jgi:HMG (high mobility group) box
MHRVFLSVIDKHHVELQTMEPNKAKHQIPTQSQFIFSSALLFSLHHQHRPPMPSENTKAPRPPNSWILYRAHALKNMPPVQPGEPRRHQGDVSQLVARMWREAPDTVRAEFERLAEEAKALHKIQFPNYRYQPRKKEDKERVKEMAKQQKESQRQAKRTRRVGQTPGLSPPPVSRPGAPYYVPNMRYGPGGPTPPLSAASSPAGDDVTSPRLRFLSAEPHVVASPASSPSLVSPVVLPPTKIEPPAIQLPFPLSPPTPASSTETTAVDNQPSQWQFLAGEPQPLSEPSSTNWDSSTGVADGNEMSSVRFSFLLKLL